MFFTYLSRNRHFDKYKQLKKFIKKFPALWKFLTWLKDRLINLSRLIDVLMMLLLFHAWPEQTYRFSRRKLLPSKKNRFSKESRPIIPYDLLTNKSSNIPKMKEINVIARGSSFDLNNIKKINGPIFLISFWRPLEIDNNGNIIYEHYYTEKEISGGLGAKGAKPFKNWTDKGELGKFFDLTKNEEYKKKNVTYVIGRMPVMEQFRKSGHNILAVSLNYMDKDGNLCPFQEDQTSSSFLNFFDDDRYNRISLVEKIYRPPLIAPHPFWAPTASFLPSLCALSYFAEKINVYGWDYYLESSPEKMSYWELFFNMYQYKLDVFRSKIHFESALINFYYGYQLSKLPNINIHGRLGQLGKHEKLIKRIERVLFQ